MPCGTLIISRKLNRPAIYFLCKYDLLHQRWMRYTCNRTCNEGAIKTQIWSFKNTFYLTHAYAHTQSCIRSLVSGGARVVLICNRGSMAFHSSRWTLNPKLFRIQHRLRKDIFFNVSKRKWKIKQYKNNKVKKEKEKHIYVFICTTQHNKIK